MRYLYLLLLPLLLFSQPIKIATYNVQNLFDATVQGTEYSEYIPGKHNWSKRMSQIKVDRTAEVICDLNADILGLQEVENEKIFRSLQKRLKRVGCGYKYAAITHKKGSAIQVALLSRFPIKNVREIVVNRAPRVRNILEAEVLIKEYSLTLFVNHWKSKGRRGYESKRIQYAKALQQRIEKLPEKRAYVILGDLNSNYNAHLTLKKRLDDTHGRRGISHILHTVKENRLVRKSEMRQTIHGVHFNPWQELPYKDRWSHKYYGNKSTLDHILLPQTLFDGKGIDYVNRSFSVFKPSSLFTKKGYINAWQIKGGKHTGKGYSDHLPIYLFVDIKRYRALSHEEQADKITEVNINSLYRMDALEHPVILKDVTVVLKRGRYAVLKQEPEERGIFIYGSVNGLKEGRKYDIRVQEISAYKGLKEITDLVILKEKGSVLLEPFYQSLETARQNEVLKDLAGVYKNHYLYVKGRKIPIYFKKRKLTPKNGSKLKIHYAHLGYYTKLQLVIYSRSDFSIEPGY